MSETHIVPCEDPDNDPEDWFIAKDGRQYPDDDLVNRQAVAERAIVEHGEAEGVIEAVEEALDHAEAEAVAANLVRRRHAKDKCFTECYFRLQCLTIALTKPEPTHGTWGGYYEEELKQIRRVRDARSHDADVGSSE